MAQQKKKFFSKSVLIKTYVFLGICIVLLCSLFFTNFFEKLLNNTWFFYSNELKSSYTKVHFIDVGQGDCSLVQVGDVNILIDAGPEDSVSSTIRYLNNLGLHKNSKIDYLILTHTDVDHVGGAVKLLKEFSFSNVYLPKVYSNFEVEKGLNINGYNVDDDNLWNEISKSIYNEVDASHMHYNFKDELIEGENFSLNFYSPLQDNYTASNSYSPIIMLKSFNFKAMFVADASITDENNFLNAYPTLVGEDFFDCDVLKVGHHGSNDSTGEQFLNAVKPEISVISVGKNNYGHPTQEVLTRLENAHSVIYRTDLTGSVVVYKNGEDTQIKTNFNFVGTIYFKWVYFVISFIIIDAVIIFSVHFKTKNNI